MDQRPNRLHMIVLARGGGAPDSRLTARLSFRYRIVSIPCRSSGDRRGRLSVSLLAADSPRLAGEDAEHIWILAASEASLPPILVHHPSMRVIDGMHRLRAAVLRGDEQIAVDYFHGSETRRSLPACGQRAARAAVVARRPGSGRGQDHHQ